MVFPLSKLKSNIDDESVFEKDIFLIVWKISLKFLECQRQYRNGSESQKLPEIRSIRLVKEITGNIQSKIMYYQSIPTKQDILVLGSAVKQATFSLKAQEKKTNKKLD